MSKTKRLTIASGVFAAIILLLLFIFRQGIRDHWTAHQKYKEAIGFMAQEKWDFALKAANDAVHLVPGSGTYQQTYTEARRSFIKALKTRLETLSPVDYLAAVHDVNTKFGDALEEEGEDQLQSLSFEHESAAMDQVVLAFDTDMDTLGKIFKGREAVFVEFFSAGNQSKARVLLQTWQSFSGANAAWSAEDPPQVAAFVEKIPVEFQKAIYTDFQKKLDGVRKQIKAKWDDANQLVAQNDYLGAKTIFVSLERHESWIPGLQQARNAGQAAGEGFYTQKIVESNIAKQYQVAGGWLRKLLQLQGRNIDDIDFDNIFKVGTTADFLQTLAKVGLHPVRPEDRKNFTDVLLVAANLDNLTDSGAAHQFLGETYLTWAASEWDKKHFATAAYLALLSQKHGAENTSDLFEKSRQALAEQFTIAISVQPETNTAANADKDFCDVLYSETVNTVRSNLPPWIKYEDADNPLSGFTPMFRIKLQVGLEKFSSDYQKNVRPVAKDYPIQVTVDNPEYANAETAVQTAQTALDDANQQYQTARQQAQAAAAATQAAASQAFGWLGGAIAGGVTSGTLNAISHQPVDVAQQNLSNARYALANTSKTVEKTEYKTYKWNEIDHTTTFHAAYEVDFGITNASLWSQSLDGTAHYTSTERHGNDEISLTELVREDPDLQKINSALADELKPKIDTLAGNTLLQGVKTTIQKYVAGAGAAASPEAQQELLIGSELLWWDTPLRDNVALANPVFIGRFGDVISSSAIVERKNPEAAPQNSTTNVPVPIPTTSPDSIAKVTSKPSKDEALKAAVAAAIDEGNPVGFVSVMGEVSSPGDKVTCNEHTTVLEAIQHAGGFTDSANKKSVRLFHRGSLKDASTIDCEIAASDSHQDLPIQPGDQIIVQRKGF